MRKTSITLAVLVFLAAFLGAAYAENHHPIFTLSKEKWGTANTANATFVEDGQNVIWRTSEFFRYATEDGGRYQLGAHSVFGEVVFKAYGVYDKDGQRTSSWFQVEKDGKWTTVENGGISVDAVRDENKKITGFTVSLYKDGKTLVTREMKRK